jgi:hypothetical protein
VSAPEGPGDAWLRLRGVTREQYEAIVENDVSAARRSVLGLMAGYSIGEHNLAGPAARAAEAHKYPLGRDPVLGCEPVASVSQP